MFFLDEAGGTSVKTTPTAEAQEANDLKVLAENDQYCGLKIDESSYIPCKFYHKKDVGEDQNQYVRYASAISNNDLEFLATLNQENGLWTPDRQATNGEPSYGFCQIHSYYHPEIVSDPKFFTDPFWQLDQCYKLFIGGTRFYGYDLRANSYDKFTLTYGSL